MQAEMMLKIEGTLDSIRPYLQADGGDVKIVGLTDEMVLQIELTGNCGSCPMSTMTLKAGVEEAVKRDIPEIKRVEAVNITLA
jgi:Fe-S cluster biogenesis protein NfuA